MFGKPRTAALRYRIRRAEGAAEGIHGSTLSEPPPFSSPAAETRGGSDKVGNHVFVLQTFAPIGVGTPEKNASLERLCRKLFDDHIIFDFPCERHGPNVRVSANTLQVVIDTVDALDTTEGL